MEPDDPQLAALAQAITQAGWRTTVMIMLDLLGPLDVISSQAVLLTRPFVQGTRLAPYAQVLSEPANWKHLRQLLDHA